MQADATSRRLAYRTNVAHSRLPTLVPEWRRAVRIMTSKTNLVPGYKIMLSLMLTTAQFKQQPFLHVEIT
jgi:hypothetical protein